MNFEDLKALIAAQAIDSTFITQGHPSDTTTQKILWCNDTFYEKTGLTEQEIVGYSPSLLLGEDLMAQICAAAADQNAAPGFTQSELQCPKADGTSFHATFWMRPITLDDKDHRYCVGTLRDTSDATATKRALEEARNSAEQARKRLWDAIEALPDGFMMLDVEDRMVAFNQRFVEFYEHSAPAIVEGASFESILRYGLENGQYPEAEGIEDSWLAERLNRAYRLVQPVPRTLPGGRHIIIHDVETSHGDIVGLRTDVTELRQQQDLLRQQTALLEEQQLRLRTLIDAVPSGVVGIGTDGRIARLNPIASTMLSISEADLPQAWPENIVFAEIATTDVVAKAACPIGRLAAGEEFSSERFILREAAKNGWQLYISATGRQIPEAQASGIQAILILEDITSRETSKQKRDRETRLDALAQLTGGVAHNFNNLMATIDFGLVLAEESEDDEERRDLLKTVRKSVERGASLSKSLLSFAKQQPGIAETLHLDAFLGEFIEFVRPATPSAIELVLDVGDPDLEVLTDPSQLQNALLNLVLNARDAILQEGSGGTIEVRVRRTKPDPQNPTARIAISVRDDGVGMEENVRARALDPFFTTKLEAGGTGLGLSSVYGFVEQCGGDMKIQSTPQEGTTVFLYLPDATQAPEATTPKAPAVPDVPPSKGSILLVEDEPDLQFMIGKILESLGYKAYKASHSAEAISILYALGADEIDLVLTDIVMPGGMDGFELGQAIRKQGHETPIIYMTGYAGYSEADMGAAVGQLLQKPCPKGVLASALEEALEKAS